MNSTSCDQGNHEPRAPCVFPSNTQLVVPFLNHGHEKMRLIDFSLDVNLLKRMRFWEGPWLLRCLQVHLLGIWLLVILDPLDQ
ncbi:hypothetical protein BDZ89DRAFT_358528 [Hymenopellis radicata]|nr:hypothetical protein BDZ89DRAFT_358528 [Hymenopellis radicata]